MKRMILLTHFSPPRMVQTIQTVSMYFFILLAIALYPRLKPRTPSSCSKVGAYSRSSFALPFVRNVARFKVSISGVPAVEENKWHNRHVKTFGVHSDERRQLWWGSQRKDIHHNNQIRNLTATRQAQDNARRHLVACKYWTIHSALHLLQQKTYLWYGLLRWSTPQWPLLHQGHTVAHENGIPSAMESVTCQK